MNRLRTLLLRFAGVSIGPGSLFFGIPTLIGGLNLSKGLQVGDQTTISAECYLDLAAPIQIGNRVNFGPQVMIITGTHQIGHTENRLGKLSPDTVVIQDGVWIGARVTILPGVTIGTGAVVGAGALVIRDVPPNTIVAGIPAKVIREIPT